MVLLDIQTHPKFLNLQQKTEIYYMIISFRVSVHVQNFQALVSKDQLWYPSRWKQVLLYFCFIVLMYFLSCSTSNYLVCRGTRFYAPNPSMIFLFLTKSKGLPWDLNKFRLKESIRNYNLHNIHYLLLH